MSIWENNSLLYKEENFQGEEIFTSNNKASISGVLEEEFEHYDQPLFYQDMYYSTVKTQRKGETEDIIPIFVSSTLLKEYGNRSLKGKAMVAYGQYCSFNEKGVDEKYHLKLFMLVTDFHLSKREVKRNNLVFLDGNLCRNAIFRTTPRGKNITDLFIAVNRADGRSNYIPCIAWGEEAYHASCLKVGDRIQLYGHMQSRKYFKKEEGEYKTTYEVSIIEFKKV